MSFERLSLEIGDRPVGPDHPASWSPKLASIDFPAMLIRMARGETVTPAVGDFRSDLWMTKYDTALFLPVERLHLRELDDTWQRLFGAA